MLTDEGVAACYDILPGVPLPWELMGDDPTETDEANIEAGDYDLDDMDLDVEEFDLDGDEDVHIEGVYEDGKPTAWARRNLPYYAEKKLRKCPICGMRFDRDDASDRHPSLCESCDDDYTASLENEYEGTHRLEEMMEDY